MQVKGKMTVNIKNGKSIVGRGLLNSDNTEVYFDYSDKPYPSSIDWKNATNLTFEPDMGKEKYYSASETNYFFQGGWVGPRLIFKN